MKTGRQPRQLSGDDVADEQACVVTTVRLTEGQIYFLDRFRARVARDTGCRISRAALLQVLAEVVSAVPPDLRDIASEADLTRRLCEVSGLLHDEGCA